MGILSELFKQGIKKPSTNAFPVKYAPDISTLKKVGKGEISLDDLAPPVNVPPGFRGRVHYYRNRCTGCQMCTQVCPSKAIEFMTEEKKIKIYIARCTFCEMCVDVCPVDALAMGNDKESFLLADYDKYSEFLITTEDPDPDPGKARARRTKKTTKTGPEEEPRDRHEEEPELTVEAVVEPDGSSSEEPETIPPEDIKDSEAEVSEDPTPTGDS